MFKYFLTIFVLCISFFSYPKEKVVLDQGVNEIEITQAKDFDKIKGKGKKEIFIQTLVPIIDKIKEEISDDRKYIESLSEKDSLEETEEKYLSEMYDKYDVKNKNVKELLSKMVIPPTSLILGQASLESGWGTSRVAKEGNNLFGMTSTLKDASKAVKVGVKSFYKKYDSIQDSVRDYIMTLSRYKSYSSLRGAINSGEKSTVLVNHLANYSEVKDTYAKRLTQIITKNNLEEHD